YNPHVGHALHNASHSSKAFDTLDQKIEYEHIRTQALGQVDHFARIGSFTDKVKIRLGRQQGPQALADEVVIISQKNTGAHPLISFLCSIGAFSGSSAVTRVPRPGSDSTVSWPPSACALSCIPVSPNAVTGVELTANPIPWSSICIPSMVPSAHRRTVAFLTPA